VTVLTFSLSILPLQPMKHIVFVDSTVSGLLAFETAKRLGHYVTFIRQSDTSVLNFLSSDADTVLAPHLKYVDCFLAVESLDSPEFRETLLEINRRRSIDILITTSEAAIVPVAREAEFLDLPYPRYDALTNAVFKNRLRGILKEHGIRSADFQVISELALIEGDKPVVGLPFVIKPTRGFAKQFSAICYTQADFDKFVSSITAARSSAHDTIDTLVSREYLIEEYIRGTLHSAEVVVQGGRLQCFATTIRFRSHYSEMLEMTATMPSGLSVSERQEIKDYVKSVFTALELDVGLYHVELLRDEKGPCLVEINARMMGSVAPQMYRMMTGIDPFELLIRTHLEGDVSVSDDSIRSAGTVVTIASRYGGSIKADYNEEEFRALLRKYGIAFCTSWVKPGQNVNVYTGNIGTIGHVIILGEDPHVVARKGHAFLQELDSIYGIELAKYFE